MPIFVGKQSDFFHFWIYVKQQDGIIGQGYGHIRNKQHRGQIHQLLAHSFVHQCAQGSGRRVRSYNKDVCSYCIVPCPAYIRHGDHNVQVRQQGGAEACQSILYRTDIGRYTISLVHSRLYYEQVSDLCFAGIPPTPRICYSSLSCSSYRFIPGYSVLLPEIP